MADPLHSRNRQNLGSPDGVLGVFAKEPRPGAVKTRLAAATSPEWAAQVAEAFLRDTLDRFSVVPARRLLGFSPPTSAQYFGAVAAGRYELRVQPAGDLGQRLDAFFRSSLDQGAERVVVIGTDSPTLPVEFVTDALDQLRTADVVIGPATDGGYYLIGCAYRVPPIFDEVDWGQSRVLEQTMSRLAGRGEAVALLPPWYDVDTLTDWQVLRGHLSAMVRAGLDPELPATRRLIQSD